MNGNRPTRNFAPLPLAVLASDAPPRAKLLMLAIFHHDWDGEKAWPGQVRLARIMSATVDTVQRATQDCRERGWITTYGARREGLTYEINVPDMNLKQFEKAITTTSRSRKLRSKVRPQKTDSPSRNLRSGQAAICGTNENNLTRIKNNPPTRPEAVGAPRLGGGFESFWVKYPRKIGMAKAAGVWDRLKPDLDQILGALAWQICTEQWTKDAGRFVPYPATYLTGRRWEDERPANASARVPRIGCRKCGSTAGTQNYCGSGMCRPCHQEVNAHADLR